MAKTKKPQLRIYFLAGLVALILIVGFSVVSRSKVSNIQGVSTEKQSLLYRIFPSIFSSLLDEILHMDVSQPSTAKSTQSTTIDITALPLGDDMYSTVPKVGYVYTCKTSYTGGGAFTQGPWINESAGTWDLTKKVWVDGSVAWPTNDITIANSGTNRVITSNNLPFHTTGIYPIQNTDDAYNYDRNPNSIESQTISFSVPLNPQLLNTPQCVGGEVGIALSGAMIFNAFDAGGRDAVATEVQDTCEGHPQAGGYYHYHGYSDCLTDDSEVNEHSELVGYAFDGFGIYGLKGEDGIELSSQDLDECHGHTHAISWNGVEQSMFHYHMTQDFPYTVGCFRGQPSVTAVTVGEGGGQQGGTQQGSMGAPSGMSGGQQPGMMPGSGMQPKNSFGF